jgi:hypothetical protein
MSFDANSFKRSALALRTIKVPVPELKDWFAEGSEPVFLVRGLSGEEFYSVREAAAKRRDLEAIAGQLLSGHGTAIADAVAEFYGAVPDEFARRVEVLLHGCVEPACDREMAMRLFKHFPATAHIIAEQILRATGEGSVVGESKGSGEIPASATTCT